MTAQREMPKYKCHKEVWALKIKAIDGLVITPEETGFAPFTVTERFRRRNDVKAGGYYVVYADGYKSYSPEDQFVEGYSIIDNTVKCLDCDTYIGHASAPQHDCIGADSK